MQEQNLHGETTVMIASYILYVRNRDGPTVEPIFRPCSRSPVPLSSVSRQQVESTIAKVDPQEASMTTAVGFPMSHSRQNERTGDHT